LRTQDLKDQDEDFVSVMSAYLLFFFFYYNICFIFYFILTLPIIIGVAGIN